MCQSFLEIKLNKIVEEIKEVKQPRKKGRDSRQKNRSESISLIFYLQEIFNSWGLFYLYSIELLHVHKRNAGLLFHLFHVFGDPHIKVFYRMCRTFIFQKLPSESQHFLKIQHISEFNQICIQNSSNVFSIIFRRNIENWEFFFTKILIQ